jgi:hypothetical protein
MDKRSTAVIFILCLSVLAFTGEVLGLTAQFPQTDLETTNLVMDKPVAPLPNTDGRGLLFSGPAVSGDFGTVIGYPDMRGICTRQI